MSVIRYVSNETTRFSTFVANRIAVIRDGSNPDQWRYVESKLNPADSASRGINIQKFLNDKEWLNGPSFLWQPELHWPQTDLRQRKLSEDDVEVKEITSSTIQLPEQQSDVIHSLIHRHSEWLKLRRVMGWVLHAVEKFKSLLSQKRTSKKKVNLADTYLTVDILKKAEHILVKHAQHELFGKELEILNRDKQDNQRIIKIGPLRKLDPFLQDGLIRVGGRLRRADIPFHSRHPVIIPKNSHISTLYLRHVHSLVGHLGKNSMLAKLREKYWIPGATTSIKTLVSKCVVCRKYQSRRLNQKMADLPTDRLIPGQPPFTSVGMDYFGPMEIKRGRSSVKRYGVIFTCLTSRAVHLELAASLTTDSCVNAIRRFVSRRGPVNVIRSDNGTNLVGSRRELKEALEELNQAKISKYLQRKDITWKFNPPAASHHGGVWERLIRSVRKILYSILQHQSGRLDDESLATLLCEVEAILNGRPITEMSTDSSDLEALTPNHLLTLRGGESLPPGIFTANDNYASRRWKQVQYLANLFWSRWVKEYLPLLQERQKWLQPHRNVRQNDLVLVMDNSPRNTWSLGRVLETFKCKTGHVRSVRVKTKTNVIVRPINKLCLILEAEV